MPNKNPPQEVYKILVSLLISRQDPASLAVIDNDYYEMEGEHIPWRKYGYGSIIEFFKNKPEYFQILRNNGVICIRGIASDKSKHVDSLVSRQKKNSTKGSHISSRNRPTLYTSYVRHRPKIPAEQLNTLVQYVQNSSEGVNINSALLMIQKQLPYVKLTEYDLRDQLRELGHQLYLEGDVIYSMERSNMVPRVDISSYRPQSLSSKPLYNASEPSTSNAMYTVPEEYPDFMDDDDFVRPNSAQYHLGQLKTDERIASSLKEHSNYGQTFNYYNYNVEEESSVEKYGDIETSEYSTDLETTEGKSSNLTNLISNKTRLRLEKLIQKYPKGIRCSELPELYMKEYKMPLNYADLGFNSVPSFVSYLPNIFYLTRENTNDDFMLYSANKRQADDNKNYSEETSKDCTETTSKTKPISVPNSQPEPNETDDDDAPFPLDMSPGLLNKFAPDDVTTYEDISHILVTDLQQSKKQYLEVYVVEVFTPSFFWIHLRKNTKPFEMFMNDLKNFYQQCHQSYSVPKLALKRGLNCACIYCGTWHRAVIKTVKPDFRVTVMFYDYGTQKTYAPEDIYYLNKRFSYLPAQAIPCGLYNVKPYIGDRWKKSITDRFIDKISDSVLAANIVSIDPPNNSMLIILTDTSEEEDVHINDWLVQENLARCGKMVRTIRNFSFEYYYIRHIANASETVETVEKIGRDKLKHDENQLLPTYGKKMHRLSDVMSKRFAENVRTLCKVPDRKIDINISERNNAEISSDATSQSRDNWKSENKPKGFVNLAKLAEIIKAKRAKSGSDISKSHMNKFNIRLHSNMRVETEPRCNDKPRHNNKLQRNDEPRCNDKLSRKDEPSCNDEPRRNDDFNYEQMKKTLNRHFYQRDSDDDTSMNENDFGTFHSTYGGHGDMTPFDWSLIRQMDSSSVSSSHVNSITTNTGVNRTRQTMALSQQVRRYHEVFDRVKKVTKPYILDLARTETEYFLTSGNIDHDDEDVLQSVERLERKLERQDNNSTEMIIPKGILVKLRMYAQSKKSSSCEAMVSSSDELKTDEFDKGENDKTRETRIDQEMENRDLDLESVKLPVDVHLLPTDALESDTERYQHTSNNKSNFKYQLLSDRIKESKCYYDSSYGSSTKGWSSSGPEPLSSYSRSSTDETMNSSDDEQKEALSRKNIMSRFNKLQNFVTKSASRELTSLNSKSDSVVRDPVSDNCSNESPSDEISPKLNQVFLLDHPRAIKILQHIQEIQRKSDSQLDSDDLSDCENNDAILNTPMIHDVLVASDLTNNNAEKMLVTPIVPILDDCNVESDDSIWDIYSGH